jgi:5S rRNA maturation endonuclease (ribonuclease M5)
MTSVSTNQRHTKAHRCPVCGGAEQDPRDQGRRCIGYMSPDGEWCRCSREEHAGPLDLEDGSGCYVHKLHGACKCGTTHGADVRPSASAIEAVYAYRDEQGAELFQVVRKTGKKFLQRRKDPGSPNADREGFVWKLGKVRRVPYHLPVLIAADPTRTVYVVEGEKDVHTLEARGHVATCNPAGAGKWGPVADTARKALAGRDVVIIADADDTGRKHARDVEASLRAVAQSIRTVESTKGKDITDHFAAGGTLEELIPLVDAPPDPEAEAQSEPCALPRVVRGKDVHRVLEDLDKALAHPQTGDPRLYQRDGELVITRGVLALDARRLGIKFAPKSIVLRPLRSATLIPRVTEHVDFGYWGYDEKICEDGKKKRERVWRPDIPSGTVLSAFLGKPFWAHVRPIRGVSVTPIIHLDGTIAADGYDPATEYLVASNVTLPEIPDRPTHDHGKAALACLREPFAEFPHETDDERYAPVALVLTILLRPVIRGNVPGFVNGAAQKNCGKSLEAKAACLLGTGEIPASNTWPRDPDEQEKMIGAAADAGVNVLFFDNVQEGATIGGAPIDKVLTCDGATGFRVLGLTQLKHLPWPATVVWTANRPRIGGDSDRRLAVAMFIRPDTPPASYKHADLLGHIVRERPRLLAAAFTLIRAWVQHGAPTCDIRRLDSFEHWGQTVAAMIAWAGGGNVRELVRDVEGTDKDVDEYSLLAALHSYLTDRGKQDVTVKELIADAFASPLTSKDLGPLREAIEGLAGYEGKGPDRKLDSKRFGKRLAKMKGLLQGGYRLRQTGIGHDNAARWTVTRPGGVGGVRGVAAPLLAREELKNTDQNGTHLRGESIPPNPPNPPRDDPADYADDFAAEDEAPFAAWVEGKGIQ